MLLFELLLAETVVATPTEALQPTEPSTLVLALIGAGSLALYQSMIRNPAVNRSANRSSGDMVGSTEKPRQQAA